MKRDRIRLCILELSLLLVLSLALLVSNSFSRVMCAIMLTIIAIVTRVFIKKRRPRSFYQRQAFWLIVGFGLIYIIGFYVMGVYFGFSKSATPFSWPVIRIFILPFTLIIVSSEIIRNALVVQTGKLSKTLTFISMVLVDLLVYATVYDITRLNDALTVLGFILFASISSNLLFNYLTVKFGSKPVIAYRLMTVLYAYFIPIIPNVFIFFRSFLRIVYPYIIYLTIDYAFSKEYKALTFKGRKRSAVFTGICFVLMGLNIALISCEFKYGLLVIGSGSMTGTIDKGDAIIFEQYRGSPIEKGEIIVFNRDDIKVVHRVVDIQNINGEYRYFTKGDANNTVDDGFISKDNIVGIVDKNIKYIGYPTLWISDIFKK